MARAMNTMYDLLVIGGGINGAGIARDAAGRGARVLLAEKDDLASHTSSASTKLIHGGLRYLEHYEFRLVRESLIERERLLSNAPHIIWPMRFVLPYDQGLRPKWMLRLGLFLYDHLGGRKILPPTTSVTLRDAPHEKVLEPRLTDGFAYSDCWVDDARLVVLNALDAKERGASIRTRTKCTALTRFDDFWEATLVHNGNSETIRTKSVVNAAGPWVDGVLGTAIPASNHQNLRLVKGSHLIFPRLFEGDHAYIFQNADNRIVFAIPYQNTFTLVGTTDTEFSGDPNSISISDEESHYICGAINEYLQNDVSPEDAVASYAGVRPLYDDHAKDNSTVTRDYVFALDQGDDGRSPPILSIFGGKITTYRKLAEHALEKLAVLESLQILREGAWTQTAPLPGGDFPVNGFDDLVTAMQDRYPWFPKSGMQRLCRAYGTRTTDILGDASSLADLGAAFGKDLFEAEIDYLRKDEFARTAEDILWRRSKLKLHLSPQDYERVTQFLA